MSDIGTILRKGPVIPVLTIDRLEQAVPVAEALVAGGLTVIEVSLHTPCALDAIRAMSGVQGAIVGAGMVLIPAELEAAVDAGAAFAASPGLARSLGNAAQDKGVPFLPGAANVSDIMLGLELGFSCFRFYPAEASGGIPALKAISAPFPSVRFCPTGGITHGSAGNWLALDSVLCVGGSWIVPKGTSDRQAIEGAARAARALHP